MIKIYNVNYPDAYYGSYEIISPSPVGTIAADSFCSVARETDTHNHPMIGLWRDKIVYRPAPLYDDADDIAYPISDDDARDALESAYNIADIRNGAYADDSDLMRIYNHLYIK